MATRTMDVSGAKRRLKLPFIFVLEFYSDRCSVHDTVLFNYSHSVNIQRVQYNLTGDLKLINEKIFLHLM